MIGKTLTLWGQLPTTQARITVSLGAIIATTVRYVFSQSGWEPSYEWLGFLLILSGLDAAQFLGKRVTDSGYVATKAAARQSGQVPIPPGVQ